MPNINQKVFNSLIKLLINFLERRTSTFSINNRSNAELVHYYYEIIRNWNKINFILKRKLNFNKKLIILNSYDTAKYLIAIYRIVWEKENVLKVGNELNFTSDIISLVDKLKEFSWKKELSSKNEIEKLSLQLAIPSFVINRLLTVMTFDSIRANIRQMDYHEAKTPFFFRINKLNFTKTQKDSEDIVLTELKKQGIIIEPDSHFSNLYCVDKIHKRDILLSRLFKESKLVIQDKASYAVAYLLEPHANELILDVCAAPGMKTSIIAQLSQNESKIIANDFSKARVYTMRNISNKLNVLNTNLINSDGIKFPIRNTNLFDKILLDAPCTGSGTFSTNPELKWRQNEGFLYQNVTLQEKLLKNAITLLKPSGILVYSTCSLYPEEGEHQVLKVFDQLKPMELPKWFSPSYKVDHQHLPGTGRLFPTIHHTKGFFIAKFKKK